MNYASDFKTLKSNGVIPNNLRRLREDSLFKNAISISDLEKLQTAEELSEVIAKRKHIISDKVIWAGFDEKHGLYTCDGKVVIHHSPDNNVYTKRIGEKLTPINHFNVIDKINYKIINLRRFSDMENNKQQLDAANALIAGLNKDLGATAPVATPVVDTTAVFTPNIATKIEDTLTSVIGDSTKAKLNNEVLKLQEFNQTHGSFIGWLVGSDMKLVASVTSKIATDAAGVKKAANGNVEIQKLINEKNTKGLTKDSYEREFELAVKQAKPTTPKAAVLKTPLEGIISTSKLSSPDFKFDASTKPSAFVVQIKEKAEFITTVMEHYRSEIKENALTHDNPGYFKIVTALMQSTKDGQVIDSFRHRLVASSKKLLGAKNWFPLQTFETISMSQVSDPETKKAIDNYLFKTLLRPTKAYPSGSYNMLPSEIKKLIKVNGQEIEGSEYTRPGSGLLKVVDPFTGVTVAQPEVPVMEFKPGKEAGKFTASRKTYRVLGNKVDFNSPLSPFKSGRFDHFLKACDGQLTHAKLIEALATTKGGAGKTNKNGNIRTLSADESTLLVQNANRLVEGSKVPQIKGLEDIKKSVEQNDIKIIRELASV